MTKGNVAIKIKNIPQQKQIDTLMWHGIAFYETKSKSGLLTQKAIRYTT